ncbi:hypothetical protein [Nocardioides sp.]|uniref:hypothetical protein n=1 Tax=Nocardioides sp. TaxID=35761 RepID=UPI003518BD6D
MGNRNALATAAVVLSLSLLAGCGGEEPSSRPEPAGSSPATADASGTAGSADPSSAAPSVAPGETLKVDAASLTLPADILGGITWRVTRAQRLQLASGTASLPDGTRAPINVSIGQQNVVRNVTLRDLARVNAGSGGATVRLQPRPDRIVDDRLSYVVAGADGPTIATRIGTVLDSGSGLVATIDIDSVNLDAQQFRELSDAVLASVRWAD